MYALYFKGLSIISNSCWHTSIIFMYGHFYGVVVRVMNTKLAVFWHVAPCILIPSHLITVSEEIFAPIFRVGNDFTKCLTVRYNCR